MTRAHTSTRAPSNSDVVFLLSQVSHWFVFSPPFFEDFPNHIPQKIYLPLNDFLRNKGSQIVKGNDKTAIIVSFTKQ